MKAANLELLACPVCGARLEIVGPARGEITRETLRCLENFHSFPVQDGIPHFTEYWQLTGFNKRFSREYDWFSLVYRAFSTIAFAFIGMSEEQGRREITDRLDPHGGKVLEVSIGPGNNLPYLVNRPDVGEVLGMDISPGQLKRCQSYTRRKGWQVDLCLANAERLPYRDEVFDGVLHIGGINFFNDKKAAILEMIRVAKPGSRILIGDETERGAKGYEKTLPGFKQSFQGSRPEVLPPISLVPAEMLEVRLSEVWKGWFYCLEFRKP